MLSTFWGITVGAGKCKKAEIPEGCELELTNVAIQDGKKCTLYAQVDEEPKICIALLDAATCPQHTFSLKVYPGSTVRFSNQGDGTLSLLGCQTFLDDDEDEDDEEIPSDFEEGDEHEEEDDDEEDEEDDDEEEEDDDEEEEEEEEEEKPKTKAVKRPEPVAEKKFEKPAKKPAKEEKPVKKPAKEEKPVKKPAKEEKPVKQDKKVEKNVNGGARCELCKKTFPNERALAQHNAAKHGK